jgi:hypothetical protein
MTPSDVVSGPAADAALSRRLAALYATLEPAERNNLRLLLGMAAGDLDQCSSARLRSAQRAALRATTATLTAIQPSGRQDTTCGVLWRGRPRWLSDALLSSLRAEAVALRDNAKLYERQYLGRGGPIAERVATSAELLATVREAAGSVTPTGVASYLYYERDGMGISPHIDTEVFALNALILLRHDAQAERTSHFVVMPPGAQEFERLPLEAGDMLLLYADSVVHGREPVGPHETVHVLTLGFAETGNGTPFSL